MDQYKLLWVDDEIELLRSHIIFLSEKGYDVDTVTNGEDAINYLHKCKQNGLDLPCLILLDLNMPRMNGKEFLNKIKTNEGLKMIPVIILTTSREDKDVLESFNYSIAGYMVKPVDYTEFVSIVKTICDYWTLSELPTT